MNTQHRYLNIEFCFDEEKKECVEQYAYELILNTEAPKKQASSIATYLGHVMHPIMY